VGVKAKEVFAASAHSPAGAPSREAAERETCVWREYPLERLGLADGTRPTAEGQVLLEFLRNGGRLERRPDDLPLLLPSTAPATASTNLPPHLIQPSRTVSDRRRVNIHRGKNWAHEKSANSICLVFKHLIFRTAGIGPPG
jgi:hypothetical protein